MDILHFKNELTTLLKERKDSIKTVGLVPTMGAIHDGHLSLIRQAKEDCDLVVASIFVNPTQFDNASDLEKYPQALENDLDILKRNFEDIIIFVPHTEEIYGEELTSEHFDFGNLASKMEGKLRSGHFDGVATVLKKFFELIRPDKAFFGEKDYQQLLIVRKLVSMYDWPIKIVGCPIRREENGLAKSSRNARLSESEKERATLLYRSLKKARKKFRNKPTGAILNEIKTQFKNNPHFELDYFEIAEADSLKAIKDFGSPHKKYRAFIAARLGEVRLIDNMPLN